MIPLAELHNDLFSRYERPLEGYAFVAVDEIGEYVMCEVTLVVITVSVCTFTYDARSRCHSTCLVA